MCERDVIIRRCSHTDLCVVARLTYLGLRRFAEPSCACRLRFHHVLPTMGKYLLCTCELASSTSVQSTWVSGRQHAQWVSVVSRRSRVSSLSQAHVRAL